MGRFKYMSAPSKLALDEGRTYESEGKTWRKNVVSEAERRQYIDHFYGDARRKKVEKIKMLTERAKRRIDSQQLCNFTALDKQTKHELMVNKQLPTLYTIQFCTYMGGYNRPARCVDGGKRAD